MSEELKELEKTELPDESLVVRPVAAPRFGSLNDDYGYHNFAVEPENGGMHVRELWRIVRKRKWLVAVIALMVTTLVTIEVHRTPSIYRATADIEVGKEANTSVVNAKDFSVQVDDADNLNTKMVVLKSRPLLEDVVVKLRLDRTPEFIEAARKLSVAEAVQDIMHRLTGGALSRHPAAERETPAEPLDGERSKEEMARLSPFVGMLKERLEVENLKDTRVLRIAYHHSDPELVAAIVNSVADNFIDRSFERKTERFTTTSAWLKKSTNELKAQAQKAELALSDYTRSRGIYEDPEGKGGDLTTNKLSEMHGQAMKAETDRIIKQSLYEEVKQGRVAQLPDNFSDPKMGALQEERGKLKVQEAELSAKFGPENPKVVEVQLKLKSLDEQIREMRGTLQEKLKADFERSVRDEAAMKAALGTAKSEAVQQNQASIQYGILKSEVETAKTLYNDFLAKTNQANLQVVEQYNNLRVIEPAEVPGAPVGPQRLRTILIGLLVSLVLGFGLAFFLEYLDNTVKNVEDVSRVAQLPTLAVIPSINSESARAMKFANRRAIAAGSVAAAGQSNLPVPRPKAVPGQVSTVVEAYRMLRTAVLLSTAGNPPKTILFTSGQPGDGKTTTAVNTALSLSQLGARVLLIDADLRRPTIHRAIRVNKKRGLSSYLSSSIVTADDVIQPSRLPNLSVIPCGPIPPNPAELVSSDRMRELLRIAADRYDHVIIDSPPLASVTDPVILSTVVDGVILVVQAGKSTRELVRRARQELANVGAKVFGVVLNNLDAQREGYNDEYLAYYAAAGSERKEAARR